MLGNWRWNLWFGIFGFVLIFLISLSNNPLITSLLRGTYALFTFFLIAYSVRFVFGVVFNSASSSHQEGIAETEQALTGTRVNYVTPDEGEDLNEVLKAQMSQNSVPKTAQAAVDNGQDQFQPLKPTQLVSTDKIEPEELTKVIRHLTGE